MMPPYLELTLEDGRALHLPTPFGFEEIRNRAACGDRRGATVWGSTANQFWYVQETPEQIIKLLGIKPDQRPATTQKLAETAVGFASAINDRLSKLEIAARRVVDERYKQGGEWEDLQQAIAELADLVGGGELQPAVEAAPEVRDFICRYCASIDECKAAGYCQLPF